MALTFKRAAKAMLATSSTTSAAFLATGLSSIMPISSFGFFAGILIPMNFLLVIFFFPTIVVIVEKHFKNKDCFSLCKKKEKEVENNQDTEL